MGDGAPDRAEPPGRESSEQVDTQEHADVSYLRLVADPALTGALIAAFGFGVGFGTLVVIGTGYGIALLVVGDSRAIG